IPLDYLKARYGTTGIDAVTMAPYFYLIPGSNTEAATYTSMSLDSFFNYVRTNTLPAAIDATKRYRTLANLYGLRLVAYEGGQHMVGAGEAQNNDLLIKLFSDFNRDPHHML